MSLKRFSLCTLLLLLTFTHVSAKENEFTIFLTRHMEKQSDVSNPSLTPKGQKKAEHLITLLADKHIQAVYSTDYARTKETAAPLAKALGLEVQIYDPRNLPAFAQELQRKQQNAFVAGHSNTTPALTYLLSKQPQQDIDESDYNNLFEVSIGDSIKVTRHHYQEDTLPIDGISINTGALHDINARYNMLLNGEIVGSASYRITVEGDVITMVENTLIEKFDINATIEARADKRTLTPLSMNMYGKMGSPADIKLKWQKDAALVEGHSLMPRPPHKPQGKITVNTALPEGTVERTSALLGIPFFDIKDTKRFRWFDAYNDEIRTIRVIEQGMETVTVPAGTFHTNKVKLEGGAPSQLFYLSNEPHPKVVKIEVLGMPWVYELTDV